MLIKRNWPGNDIFTATHKMFIGTEKQTHYAGVVWVSILSVLWAWCAVICLPRERVMWTMIRCVAERNVHKGTTFVDYHKLGNYAMRSYYASFQKTVWAWYRTTRCTLQSSTVSTLLKTRDCHYCENIIRARNTK